MRAKAEALAHVKDMLSKVDMQVGDSGGGEGMAQGGLGSSKLLQGAGPAERAFFRAIGGQ